MLTYMLADDATIGASTDIGSFCELGVSGPSAPPLIIGSECTIRSHSVIYRGVRIGDRVSTGHGVLIRDGTIIGDRCSIGSHTVLEHSVSLGRDVRVHSQCFIPEHSTLRDGCWIGPGVTLTNARYPNRADTKANLAGVTIEENAVVGARCVVLPGVVIGKNSLVGAGSLVAEDVPEGATVIGPKAWLR